MVNINIIKLITILLLLVFTNRLNSQDMHWKTIEIHGTEKSEEGIGTNFYFYKFNFISPKTGFLLGEYKNRNKIGEYKKANIDKHKDAIILATNDGGHHWEEKILGNGAIIDFKNIDEKLILLRRSYHGENAEVLNNC